MCFTEALQAVGSICEPRSIYCATAAMLGLEEQESSSNCTLMPGHTHKGK